MKKNFLKVLIIALFAFVFCTACTNEVNKVVKDKNDIKIADYEIKPHCRIVKIGNHEYLYFQTGYTGSICHYPDCEYCNKRNNKVL